MENYFKDKVAVVTGAGGTLCSCIAGHLAKLGAKVVLIGRTEEKLKKTAEAIKCHGGKYLICPCDVNDENAVRKAADEVLTVFGPCDMLINGAGGNNIKAMTTDTKFTPEELTDGFDKSGFFNLDMEWYKSVLLTNTVGTVITSKIFGMQMARNGGGAILNFASMNTYCPLTRVPAYAMSKAAIANFTEWLSAYLAPAGIRVNAIAPGFFVNERSIQYLGSPETGLTKRGEQVIGHTPAGRFGKAEDLLGCAEWLLNGEKSNFVTGITVPIDGGFLALSGV